MTVAAQTDPARGPAGIGAFIVQMDSQGVSSQTFRDPGCRPIGRGSVTLDNVFVPDEYVIGGGAAGFRVIMTEFDLSRTLLGLMCGAAARRAIDMAIEYSKVRTSFGHPLATYQGVSLPIAEHLTYLEAVRTLGYHALGLRAAGKPHTSQAAMLKWWGPLVGFRAIQEAVLLHGNVGYSDEMPLQALLRDVSAYQIGDGTAQINKLVIARTAIGREVMPR
jgi:cyclohexanecarboxyl-CoA dehydrogenase